MNIEPNLIKNLDNEERTKELRPTQLLTELGMFSKHMVCVDLGCGTGFFTIPMAEITGVESRIYAVDKRPYLIDYLKQKGTYSQIHCITNELFNTGLHKGTVDRCLVSSVLHATKLPLFVLREAQRLLKSDGKLIIVEPKIDAVFNFRVGRVSPETVNEWLTELHMTSEYYDWSEKHYVIVSTKVVENVK